MSKKTIRAVKPMTSGVTIPEEQDIICADCENIISDEEIGYGFIYWDKGQPFCHQCKTKIQLESDKGRFDRIKKAWEEYNSNENILYGFADLVSNEDFEFLIRNHESMVNEIENILYTMNNMEGTFWKVCQKSKEGDILTNLDWDMQNIVNNGDYTFMWEESWKPVTLNDEFLGARWKIKEK